MIDEALVTTTVAASPETCWAVAIDVENYPTWAADVKEATIIERDDNGLPVLVSFRAAAMGRSTSYVLRYDVSDAPRRLSWTLVEGDVTAVLDGHYIFDAVPGEPDATAIDYRLKVELRVPLPGFVKRRAEGRIIHAALSDFQARVES